MAEHDPPGVGPGADPFAPLVAQLPVDLGCSSAVQVTQEMVDVHAETTGDAQWIHNDPERARRESPFGGPVAQGFLLLSLLTRLSSDLVFPDSGPVQMMVNYGLDRVRFVSPVPVGSSVQLRGVLSGLRPRGDGSAVLSVDVELDVVGDGRSGGSAPTTAVAARWLFLAVGPAE